jgi:Cu(I)/Ag(I) efflux system membrane fusion protein
MTFRHGFKKDLFVFFCPTAFNGQGAYWIEADENRRNPYFGRTPHKGQDMLTCGELAERIPPDILEPESHKSSTGEAEKSLHPTESHPESGRSGGQGVSH